MNRHLALHWKVVVQNLVYELHIKISIFLLHGFFVSCVCFGLSFFNFRLCTLTRDTRMSKPCSFASLLLNMIIKCNKQKTKSKFNCAYGRHTKFLSQSRISILLFLSYFDLLLNPGMKRETLYFHGCQYSSICPTELTSSLVIVRTPRGLEGGGFKFPQVDFELRRRTKEARL